MAQTGPGWWELRCEDHIQSQAQGLPGQLAKIRSQKSLERALEGVSQGYSACLECMRVQSLVMKNNSTVLLEMLQTNWSTQEWWKDVCLVPL